MVDRSAAVRYIRSTDGLISFGLAVTFLSATFLNWCLPCIPVTRIVPSPRGVVSDEIVKFCQAGHTSPDPSVASICACIQTSSDKNICANDPDGVPEVQELLTWFNPNFVLAYLCFSSSLYQLMLRNSLEINPQDKAWIAKLIVSLGMVIAAVFSIFQHPPLTVQPFLLLNFFPQQFLIVLVGMIVYDNIQRSTQTLEVKQQFKLALWNGAYRATTLPFIALLLAAFQHNTDELTLSYVYNIVLFIALCDLTYALVAVEEMAEQRNLIKNPESPPLGAKLRLQQTTYFATLAAILAYSIFTLIFMPMTDDPVLSRLTLIFNLMLWILHVLYDASNAKFVPGEYHRVFNVADGILAVTRYAVVGLVAWLIV